MCVSERVREREGEREREREREGGREREREDFSCVNEGKQEALLGSRAIT